MSDPRESTGATHRRSIIEEAQLAYAAHWEQMLLAYPHLQMTPWDDQDAAVREAWIEAVTPEGSDREVNDLMALAYKQAMEDAKHSVSPCFANCGEPACQKLGCIRVYNERHRNQEREQMLGELRERFPGYGEDVA